MGINVIFADYGFVGRVQVTILRKVIFDKREIQI